MRPTRWKLLKRLPRHLQFRVTWSNRTKCCRQKPSSKRICAALFHMFIGRRLLQIWHSPLKWLTMEAQHTLTLSKNPTSPLLSWRILTKVPLKNSRLMNMAACPTHKPSLRVQWRITCWCLKLILDSKHPFWWNSVPKLCRVSKRGSDSSITLLQNYINRCNSRLLSNVKWTSAPIKLASLLSHQTTKIYQDHRNSICPKEIVIFQWERKLHSKTVRQGEWQQFQHRMVALKLGTRKLPWKIISKEVSRA